MFIIPLMDRARHFQQRLAGHILGGGAQNRYGVNTVEVLKLGSYQFVDLWLVSAAILEDRGNRFDQHESQRAFCPCLRHALKAAGVLHVP